MAHIRPFMASRHRQLAAIAHLIDRCKQLLAQPNIRTIIVALDLDVLLQFLGLDVFELDLTPSLPGSVKAA